ncbi:MAG: hypothetical protein JW860_10795 [Sedimentisphaerales bacterium]|nr:hypothetical protein [Sedimentisphaerales bacterium]
MISVLLLILPQISTAQPLDAAGAVDTGTVYQELEGFGASGSHYENWLVAHPLKNEIYDVIFGQLGLDIYRIRNAYDILPEYIDRTAEIVQAAETSLGHPINIMITSGSPPDYLKSNGSTAGGTLKKDASGDYMYPEFAQWWADSLSDYTNHGINIEYVSVQNEPDWLAEWETCKFLPTETEDWAGYDQAFEAVYQELDSQMAELPKFLAPETMGFGGSQAFIDALIDPCHVYGFAHHLYTDGEYYNPDSFIPGMQNYATNYGYKPLFQTECSGNNDELDFNGAMTLAKHMHNSLVHEGVCSYLYWDLFWGDAGGLVAVEFPWQSDPDYIINQTYYAFKQYSAFTDPGWHRIAASTDNSDVRISAYISPDANEVSIVILNVDDTNINLTLSLTGFNPDSAKIYRTSETENCAYIGTFTPSQPLLLPAQSISTIRLRDWIFPDTCAAVLAAGYRLAPDITSDCYVNHLDLYYLIQNWLNTTCTAPDHCAGADLEPDGDVDLADFTQFAQNWLRCNTPEDPTCIPNW